MPEMVTPSVEAMTAIQYERLIFWEMTVSLTERERERERSYYEHVSNSEWLPT